MVGTQAYGTLLFSNQNLGQGTILPGSFNTGTATQDEANINAGLLRVDFLTPFLFPPVIVVQPIRVSVGWTSPGDDPFMPDGTNVHRNVFPLPESGAVGGIDETLGDQVARVDNTGALPEDGRPMHASSRIEIESMLLDYRLMSVERTHFVVQFAGYLGKIVRVVPHKLADGTTGTDDVQHGTVTEILFGYMGAGDLETS